MIEARSLSKSYGEIRAVDDVSFGVGRGEVVGFLGPNGAGKSTTLKILAGVLHPDSGSVTIAGRLVEPADPASRRTLGYLPESTPLYRRMRVDAYLDWVGDLRGLARARRREAIASVGELCGLTEHLRRPISQLSKGYRQRVGLAQALLTEPDVLLLDEPTSGLDPGERARMRGLIRDLGRERTILLSTHVLSEVQETCRRVVILAGGRVVADGTPLDLAGDQPTELRVTLRAVDPAAVLEALAALAGVGTARLAGSDAAGHAAFALEVDERFAAAEAVTRLVSERGWALVELRHELPSLETVFLRRTELAGGPPPAGGAGADPGTDR